MLHMIKPPQSLTWPDEKPAIFLAGSIEMDRAVDWQTAFAQGMGDASVVLLNPRRDTWDASWEQSIENGPFREQVEWELEALERASLIVMYFDPKTKSPISLLELGLFARSKKLIVCCPAGFWRKGNVDIVCARYGIAQAASLGELIEQAKRKLQY